MTDDLRGVSFHDAEVIALRLDRAGPRLELDVAVVFPQRRMLRVVCEGVSEVELDGFNEQNVLFDLAIVLAAEGLMDVELQSTYGIGGRVRCASVTVVPT